MHTILVNQYLEKLKVLWCTTNEFKEFMNRKELHNSFQKNVICNTLPNLFFNNTEAKFKKYFTKQWLSDKLILLILTAILSISKAFYRSLLIYL